MPESKFHFQNICPTRNPNNEFRKLAEKKVFEGKQEKQKEQDQETQENGIVEITIITIMGAFIFIMVPCIHIYEIELFRNEIELFRNRIISQP